MKNLISHLFFESSKNEKKKKLTQNKISTVMREFKSGSLQSSSGKAVTNKKQAVAIALSVARKIK